MQQFIIQQRVSNTIDKLYTEPFEVFPGTKIYAKAVVESNLSSTSIPTNMYNPSRKAVSQRYFLESGIETKELTTGITIIRTLYDDGTSKVEKVLIKK